jgi:CHASE1-domain containing sensor protein
MGRNMSGAMVPRGTFPSYDVLSYIHPLASNLGVLGFDLNVDPVRKDAIMRSTLSRSDAATGKIYLPHVKA